MSIAQAASPTYGYGGGAYGNGGQDPAASAPPLADMVWRTVLAAGSVPAMLTFWWRVLMPETARYTSLIKGDAAKTLKVCMREKAPGTILFIRRPACL